MDEDFHLELIVPQEIHVLAPFLKEFPFEVKIGKHDQNEDVVLVQSATSTVAGFYYEGCEGNKQFYGITVPRAYPGEPEEVMQSLSRVLQKANLAHRFVRIIHELNEDEEVVSYEARSA